MGGGEGRDGSVNVMVLLICLLSCVCSSIIHTRKENKIENDEKRKLK